MPTTPTLGLRYPAPSAAPNVPQDLSNLATDTETQVLARPKGPWRATQLLATTTASITFSSIPTTIRRLVVSWTARTTATGAATDLWMRVNGSTSTVYSSTICNVNNTTQTNLADGAQTRGMVGICGGQSSAANNFGAGEVRIAGWNSPHVANLNWQFQSQFWESPTLSYYAHGGGLFVAASPFTSLTFLPQSGSFVAGTQFALIGWE